MQLRLRMTQSKSGFFTEIAHEGEVVLPTSRVRWLRVGLEQGIVEIHLPKKEELTQRVDWVIEGAPSVVRLVLPEGELPDFEIRNLETRPKKSEGILRDYAHAEDVWRAGGIPQLVITHRGEGNPFELHSGGVARASEQEENE